jgi:ABC-type polysaccharide/polyol phosphate export permease
MRSFGRFLSRVTLGIALLLPLSGIFYPVSALPGALQPLAKALPSTQ